MRGVFVLAVAAGLATPCFAADPAPRAGGLSGRPVAAVDVRLEFKAQPYADYVHYLLYRETAGFADLQSAVPIAAAPLDHRIYFPDEVAATDVKDYRDLYKMAEQYDERAQLKAILTAGEPKFAAFTAYWRAKIAPAEQARIALWRREDRDWKPFVRLQQMERVPANFDRTIISVSALDPAASSNANARPPIIFTSTQSIPDLAWVIGHEGTHMVVGAKGANWQARPKAAEVLKLVGAKGGNFYDVEEALCLVMQVKLSQALGQTKPDYLVSTKLKPSITRSIAERMEANWPRYLSGSGDVVDYMLDQALAALKAA